MNTCHVVGDSSGLTLVELMIVLVLSMVLMSAVYISTQASRSTRNDQYNIMALQQDLRAVMDIMEIDIHNAGCDPLLANSPTNLVFDIQEAGPKRFCFTFDANMDGVLEMETEKIAYQCMGQSLTRSTFEKNIAGDKETFVQLLNYVKYFQITYYDANGSVAASKNDISSVQVDISLSDAKGLYRRELKRRIQLRNPRV